MASSKFNFPYESLTSIAGKPTSTTFKLLQRQLFTNARSVPSARGGGNHDHLAILITSAEYLARVGIPFTTPVHPGPPPAAEGTAVRNYNDALADVTLYNNLRAALTAQILIAVNASFLAPQKILILDSAILSHLPCSYICVTSTAP